MAAPTAPTAPTAGHGPRSLGNSISGTFYVQTPCYPPGIIVGGGHYCCEEARFYLELACNGLFSQWDISSATLLQPQINGVDVGKRIGFLICVCCAKLSFYITYVFVLGTATRECLPNLFSRWILIHKFKHNFLVVFIGLLYPLLAYVRSIHERCLSGK